MWLGRIYLWNALPNGKRAGFYSITSLRRSHPDWFKEDLAKLIARFAWRDQRLSIARSGRIML